jgi:DNA polymerase I-like protein with 3'-5' exonuclease and polymerase domains/uracil-DNA glycosylase
MKQLRPIGPLPSRIMLIDECPRKADLETGQPFSGYLGQELGKLLSEVGIRIDGCYSTWVIKEYCGDGGESLFAHKKKDITPLHKPLNGKPALPQAHLALEPLIREIEQCQPNIILAFGNTAMFVLTGQWGIQNYRGSLLDCTLPGLSYQPKVIPTYPIGRIMWQWEMKPIMQQDLRRVIKEQNSKIHIRPDYKFLIRPNYGQALSTLEMLYSLALRGPLKLGVDIETRSYHIACIQLGWSTLEAICLPLMCVERQEGYWTLDEEAVLMFKLYKLLTHPNCQVIGQNFHYDAQYFYRYLLFVPNLLRDTMIAQHSMFSTMDKGLDFLSSMYCEYHVYWKGEGKEWTADINEDQLWAYGCKDAVITYEVDTAQQKAISQMGLREVSDFQQKLWWPVLETMIRGLRVDKDERGRFANLLFEEIGVREMWMYELLGRELNIRSPQQMADLFYVELGQKVVKDKKSHNPTTNEEALRTIAEREPLLRDLCRKITEIRSLGVFLSTFVKAPLDIDGKTRCMFKIPGTKTYRFASAKNAFGTGMNLQNIPSGGEDETLDLPNIRTLFIPDIGYEYFDIDLDSADLRIVAWESGCQEMKAMVREGKKVYVEVMKEYYHDQSLTKASPQYGIFKSFCHGTHYLGTDKGLAGRLGLLVHEVTKLQKWYFGKFPEIKKWHETIKNQVLTRRMVKNVFGYRLYIFEKIEGTLMNEVIAWIPQSTVGCLINRIYMKIYENLKEVQVLLQVHDSLAGQYPVAIAEQCRMRILEGARIELPYDDPMVIPVGIKISRKSWGDCK